MMKSTPERRPPPEEVLAFMLGNEEYGIDMRQVEEIFGFESFARDAEQVEIEKGRVRLRGRRVPIIDMRVRFSLGKPVYDESTSVIIVRIDGRIMSMVVDGISDVHRLDASQLKPLSKHKGMPGLDCLIGVGTIGPHKVTLIAVDKLMHAAGSAARKPAKQAA